MTECPLKTRHFMQFNVTKYLYHIFRCVSRNFCDNNGMVTSSKHNDFAFEDDKRGFIVSRTNNGGNFTLTISTPGLCRQLEECARSLLCGPGDSALWPGPASQTGRCLQSKLDTGSFTMTVRKNSLLLLKYEPERLPEPPRCGPFVNQIHGLVPIAYESK